MNVYVLTDKDDASIIGCFVDKKKAKKVLSKYYAILHTVELDGDMKKKVKEKTYKQRVKKFNKKVDEIFKNNPSIAVFYVMLDHEGIWTKGFSDDNITACYYKHPIYQTYDLEDPDEVEKMLYGMYDDLKYMVDGSGITSDAAGELITLRNERYFKKVLEFREVDMLCFVNPSFFN